MVVQGDALNRSRIATVVCVPLTSNVKWAKAPGKVSAYRPNDKHVVFSAHGLVQLPPSIEDGTCSGIDAPKDGETMRAVPNKRPNALQRTPLGAWVRAMAFAPAPLRRRVMRTPDGEAQHSGRRTGDR